MYNPILLIDYEMLNNSTMRWELPKRKNSVVSNKSVKTCDSFDSTALSREIN